MSSSPTHIFLVHGIFSNSSSLIELAEFLRKEFPDVKNVKIESLDYKWEQNILSSANEVKGKISEAVGHAFEDTKILLIGHSQGGLICRLVALLLRGKVKSVSHKIDDEMSSSSKSLRDEIKKGLQGSDSANILGVVTLATPNDGALTYGQMNLMASMIAIGTKSLAGALAKFDCFTDLSTDRTLGLMQFFDVSEVKYLTISGSSVNRYTTSPAHIISGSSKGLASAAAIAGHGALKKLMSFAGNISISFDKPNDGIVEDASVDLNSAHLRSEIQDLSSQVTHYRQYFSCNHVHHVNIHKSEAVQNMIADWINTIF